MCLYIYIISLKNTYSHQKKYLCLLNQTPFVVLKNKYSIEALLKWTMKFSSWLRNVKVQ